MQITNLSYNLSFDETCLNNNLLLTYANISHIKSFSKLKKFDPISKCPLKESRSYKGTQLANVP